MYKIYFATLIVVLSSSLWAAEEETSTPSYQRVVLVNENTWTSCSALVEGPVNVGQRLKVNGFNGEKPITVEGIVVKRGKSHSNIDPQDKHAVLVLDTNLLTLHLAYTLQALTAGDDVLINRGDGITVSGKVVKPLR